MARTQHAAPRRRRTLFIGGVVAAALIGFFAWKMQQEPPRARDANAGLAGLATALLPDAQVFARYAGSESCRECHAAAYNAWQTSHHALAERAVDPQVDSAAFHPPRTIRHGTQTSETRASGARLELITAGPENRRTPFAVDRVIGEKPLRQFLIPGKGGRYQVTELAYDPAEGDWFDVFGDEDRQPGEWGHWTGRGMTWNQMCASCHNTRLRKHYDSRTDEYATTMAERSVGCESCHGAMADHVRWQKPRPQPAKNDPTIRKLDRSRMMAACAACHARRSELTGEFEPGDLFLDHYLLTIPDDTDLYYADGQVRDENYEYASFLSSKMFADGVSCLDCHEPHAAKVKANDNSLCMRCHETPLPPAPKIIEATHTFHAAGTSGSRCVDCHMPQTTYMQRDPRRDHSFSIPDPLLTKEHAIPNACNGCHKDKDVDWAIAAVDKWYGQRMDRPSRSRTRAVAKARQGDTNAIPGLLSLAREEKIGLWRASATRLLSDFAWDPPAKPALLARAADANPLVRANAAHALFPLVRAGDAQARQAITRLLEDEVRAVRVEAAWTLHDSVDTNSVAGRDLWHSLTFNLDQPAGAAQFASFLFDRGDAVAALGWFEKAVAWDGNSAPLRDALAVCLSALGRSADAVREMEAACRTAPRDAQYRYKLGLALNESGRLPEAIAALEKAVELAPEFAAAWYNLGLGYSQLNRSDDALDALGRAETLDNTSPRIPYARATILARTGRIAEARRAAQRALEVERNFAEAQQLLQALSGP